MIIHAEFEQVIVNGLPVWRYRVWDEDHDDVSIGTGITPVIAIAAKRAARVTTAYVEALDAQQ